MPQQIDRNSDPLFSTYDIRQLFDKVTADVNKEVDQIDPNRFLNTAPSDLSTYFLDKYIINPPHLHRENWSVNESEVKIDVSQDPNRWIPDRSRSYYIPGQQIEVEVPFVGNNELFHFRPTSYTFNPPRAKIQDQSLFIIFHVAHNEQADIRKEIDQILNDIETYLSWISNDVTGFNKKMESDINELIENRRQRILNNQGRVAALGIPIKSRNNNVSTYTAPSVRKKVIPTLPPATSIPYEPEPVLDFQIYEHILKVIQNMSIVMERSPSAFRSMKEEDIRQHFLVQLNGQFEGNATGETFNSEGKTDILIRENGRNIFIAECKFWNGPKYFNEAIDQLLGYTAWRDTKTAILVFNRGKTMNQVLSGIKAQTEGHKNFKRTLDWKHETGFRYVFSQKVDPNREFILTILVFDIPSPE